MSALQTKIWLALRSRVETIDTDLPIIWPSQSGDVPQGRSLEVLYMPNRPTRLFLGSTDPSERRGILQIGLLSELTGASEHQETFIREIAGTIADHFVVDMPLRYAGVTVRVYEAPEVAASIKDDARNRLVTPIRIRWECFE